MKAQCVRCGAPTDATVCRPEALSLAETLQIAAGHAEDAETVIARQVRYGAGGRGGRSEPLPVDLTASARLAAVGNTIGTWMRIVLEESGARPPAPWRPMAGALCPPTRPGDEPRRGGRCGHGSCAAIRDRTPPSALAAACSWLATQVGWLRKHPAAGEAWRELEDACEQLRRLVDRPADRELVGMCDCGRTLYAPHGRGVVTCPERTCQLRWEVAESRDILRAALNGKLVTAGEAARLAAYLDGDRTQDTIRKLIAARVKTGQIAAHGMINGEPAYRFGEISAVLAAIPQRNREGAAA